MSKVFINYRRSGDTSSHVAGRIYDRLRRDLGRDHVFMDVDSRIPLGRDFAQYLEKQLEKCGYVLALIGPAWFEVRNGQGQRRLDDPNDWVRVELAAALKRGIPVVPVLVDGGNLPAKEALPKDLQGLPGRQALTLTSTGFHRELDHLVGDIKDALNCEERVEIRDDAEEVVVELPTSHPAPHITVSQKSGIELVRIEGGTFCMGAPASEKEADEDERPPHRVMVSSFWLGRFPVTNEQYAHYITANPGVPKPEHWADDKHRHPGQPVVGVSWKDAERYARWAGLRLPSEAEWEYACRAGSKGRFCCGEKHADLDRIGWHEGNSRGHLHAAGELAPNAWGLHDMHGNIWEWCADWYGRYMTGDQVNPTGPARGEGRVYRGGSFLVPAKDCRSAYRGWGVPDEPLGFLGFRLASSQ